MEGKRITNAVGEKYIQEYGRMTSKADFGDLGETERIILIWVSQWIRFDWLKIKQGERFL